jgi:RNA 2',3'-cyclic 3'-phosphodiesterase
MRIGRAFVAVELPDGTLDAVGSCIQRCAAARPAVRWTARSAWHVTIQFLGAVDDLAALQGALGDATRPVQPATVRLGGGGAFPQPKRGNVLWLGVVKGAAELEGIAAAVTSATAGIGYQQERRPFRPHVTVARSRERVDLRPHVDALGAEPVGPAWRVADVVLLASETRPDGARYSEVGRFGLGG